MIPTVNYDVLDREFVVNSGKSSYNAESAIESWWPQIKAAGLVAKTLNKVYAEHITDHFAWKAVDGFEKLAQWSYLMADRFNQSPIILFDGIKPRWHFDSSYRLEGEE